MRKISGSLSNENEELKRLRSKKQDLLLLLDGGEKRLKVAQSRSEEKQVEENIMRLRVSQLERMTSNMSDKVYNLEKHRLHLEAVSYYAYTSLHCQSMEIIRNNLMIKRFCGLQFFSFEYSLKY